MVSRTGQEELGVSCKSEEVLSPGDQDACCGGSRLEPAGWPGHSCRTRAVAGAPAVEGPRGLVAA